VGSAAYDATGFLAGFGRFGFWAGLFHGFTVPGWAGLFGSDFD
jgi:hypothetical protein